MPSVKKGEQDVAGGFEPTSFLSHCHPESTSPPRQEATPCLLYEQIYMTAALAALKCLPFFLIPACLTC